MKFKCKNCDGCGWLYFGNTLDEEMKCGCDENGMVDIFSLVGKSRTYIKQYLGEPDQVSIGTKKYKIPMVYKYDKYEIYFGPGKDDTAYQVKINENN